MIELMLAILVIALAARHLKRHYPAHAVKVVVLTIGLVTWLLVRYWQRNRRK